MNAKATITLSAVLHLAFVGYLYTLEIPETYVAEDSTIRRFATVQTQFVRPGETLANDADDPAAGTADPVVRSKTSAERELEPEREPEPEPEREPEPEPDTSEELASVVTDKADQTDSPVETDSETDADAKAVASTAPVDSDGGEGATGSSAGDSDATSDGDAASEPPGVRGGTGEDRTKLNQKYGLELYRKINESKSYPRFARKAHIEGKLLIAITVDRSGSILEVELRESSGHEILDRHTVDAIRKMKRFPVPPDAVEWETKTFVLPVSYELT